MNAIPRESALQLCQEIRQQNRGKWYTIDGLRCWGCSTFSGSLGNRRFASRPDFRGCGQVNTRFDSIPKATVAAAAEPPAIEIAALVQEGAEVAEAPAVDMAAPTVDEEAVVEPLPIFGHLSSRAPAEGWKSCGDCGRLFRPAEGQENAEYCPTCEYRRVRKQLSEQDRDDEGDEE